MNLEKLKKFEEELQNSGYRKYSSNNSDLKEDYGWYKTKYDNNDVREYTIEFRVWNFTKYKRKGEESYSIDVLILDGDTNERIDLTVSYPKISILEAENLAENLHILLRKCLKKL